jgi:hypothetical protein
MKSYRQLARDYGLRTDQVSLIVRLRGIEPTAFGTAYGISESQEREIRDALLLIGDGSDPYAPKSDHRATAVA